MYDQIDGNRATVQLAYGGGKLYQRHDNGAIWNFNGPHASPRWTCISGPDSVRAIAASPKHVYKLLSNGKVYRYDQDVHKWAEVKELTNVKDVIASHDKFFYVLNGSPPGIGAEAIDDPSPSFEDLERDYENLKNKEAQDSAEIVRLQGGKQADEQIIRQLHADYEAVQTQNLQLTAELKSARDQAAQKEKELQEKIANLEGALSIAEAAEKKLANDLDEEKKKEHEEWKKEHERDALEHKALDEAHKALEESQARNVELQATVDALNKEVDDKKAEIGNLETALTEAKKKEELADAELKKHLTDDAGENLIISGLEKVIQGLKKEIEGQEELIGVLRKHLTK